MEVHFSVTLYLFTHLLMSVLPACVSFPGVQRGMSGMSYEPPVGASVEQLMLLVRAEPSQFLYNPACLGACCVDQGGNSEILLPLPPQCPLPVHSPLFCSVLDRVSCSLGCGTLTR